MPTCYFQLILAGLEQCRKGPGFNQRVSPKISSDFKLGLLIAIVALSGFAFGQSPLPGTNSDQQSQESMDLVTSGAEYRFVDDDYERSPFGGFSDGNSLGFASIDNRRYYIELFGGGDSGASEGIEWHAGVGGSMRLMPPFSGGGAAGMHEPLFLGQPSSSRSLGRPSVYGERSTFGIDPRFISFQLGPLLVDQVLAGSGVLYSEFTGHSKDFPQQRLGDDGLGSIVWLSARVSVDLTEHLKLAVRPMLYWLPNTGEVGYGLPPLFLGLPNIPESHASLTLEQDIGNWSVLAYEIFGVRHRSGSILDDPSRFADQSDTTPVDRVGRYSLGSMYGSETDYEIKDLNGRNDPFDPKRFYFYNRVGTRVVGHHNQGIQSILFLNRLDAWDHDFVALKSWLTGGMWVTQRRDYLSPYFGYTFMIPDDSNSSYNTLTLGVKWDSDTSMSGFLQGGYHWTKGLENDNKSWLGEAGIKFDVGPYTRISIQGGRRVTDNQFNRRFLENYVEGRVIQQLGATTTLALVAGAAKRDDLEDRGQRNESVKYAGLLFSHSIAGSRTLFTLFGGYEDVSIERRDRDFGRFTFRTNLWVPLSESMFLSAFYQYQQSDSSNTLDEYQEHLLYGGVTKRF